MKPLPENTVPKSASGVGHVPIVSPDDVAVDLPYVCSAEVQESAGREVLARSAGCALSCAAREARRRAEFLLSGGSVGVGGVFGTLRRPRAGPAGRTVDPVPVPAGQSGNQWPAFALRRGSSGRSMARALQTLPASRGSAICSSQAA